MRIFICTDDCISTADIRDVQKFNWEKPDGDLQDLLLDISAAIKRGVKIEEESKKEIGKKKGE